MQLREIMETEPATVEPGEPASAAWSRLRRQNSSHLIVIEDGHPIGILSERDLGGSRGSSLRRRRTVRDLMTPQLIAVESSTTLRKAANLMRRRQIGSLPVIDDGRLVGIVTENGVLDALDRDSARRSQPSSAAGRKSPARRSKRGPFPGWVPRPLKTEPGRATGPLIPAHIRLLGTYLSREERIRIRQKLGARLGKFGRSIERVSVRVTDINGPRGGVDQVCRIKVVLDNLPSVVFESQDASLDAAVGAALEGTERAVRRTLQRRRMKPLKGRRGPATPRRPVAQ